MSEIQVSSLEEAVSLATSYKKSGQYDWFRGQSQDWPLAPTLARLNEEQRDEAISQVNRFFYWVVNTPGLDKLKKQPDTIWAIAQHYGLATNFLDFTTEPSVAGYFASSKRRVTSKRKSCIYCINTKEVESIWNDYMQVFSGFPKIEFIEIHVANLWRLEAQCGVFLICPENWEYYIEVNRIVFPPSAPLFYPSKDDLLPPQKSHLELLVDHYFQLEEYHQSLECTRKIFPEAKTINIESPKSGYEARYFKSRKLPLRRDWQPKETHSWVSINDEVFRDTAVGTLELQVETSLPIHIYRKKISSAVYNALQLNPKLRWQSIKWVLRVTKKSALPLANGLSRLWNGLRSLPYSDEALSESIALYCALHRLGLSNTRDRNKCTDIVKQCIDSPIRVVSSSWDGSYLYSYVSSHDLHDCIRHNIKSYLLPKYKHFSDDILMLLQCCWNPRRIFQFKRFSYLFATQIVPVQGLIEEQSTSHYSPARLKEFGLP